MPKNARRPDDVREDARDAVQRPHRPRLGRALVGLERAEPAAVPDPAVRREEDRRSGELREALQGRLRRRSRRATRWRRSRSARRPPADATSRSRVSARPSRPARSRKLLAKVKGLKFDAWAHHPYPTSPNLPPMQKVRYPNVTLSTLPKFEERSEEVVPSHRCRSGSPSTATRRSRPSRTASRTATAGGVREAGADHREEGSERADVHLVRLPRQRRQPVAERARSRSRARRSRRTTAFGAARAPDRRHDRSTVKAGTPPRVTMYVPYLAYYSQPGHRDRHDVLRVARRRKAVAVGQPTATLGGRPVGHASRRRSRRRRARPTR